MNSRQTFRIAHIDKWLADGGVVLTANERAARSVSLDFGRVRRAEGCSAWATPAVFAWDSWVREEWRKRNRNGLVLLNPLQEQALWMRVIGRSRTGQGLLHPGRLADAAQRAYRLLCSYEPNALKASARIAWTGDAAIFSEWLEAFESRCRREGLVSNSRLGLELTEPLAQERFLGRVGEVRRRPLLLIGFDWLLETQKALLDAWGDWRLDGTGQGSESRQFLAAPDAAIELAACVGWLRAELAKDPEARLIVVTTALQERRGELERALLDSEPDGEVVDFEFSLGVPLGQTGLVRSAVLMLRWLHESLSEGELDWLIGAGHCAASYEEEIALAEAMRVFRRRGQERPEWELDDFASPFERGDTESEGPAGHAAWAGRVLSAREQLRAMPKRQSPLEWAEAAQRLLKAVGWPGFRPLSSVAFQALDRWERLLEDCGSLGFDGSQMEWAEFVATVADAVSATIFAAESSDARVQITEPLESAGQLADGIWFLGANEEAWPGRGQPNSLLPIGLQREMGMPHASPQADWELAQQATDRLFSSASEVVFSYAKLSAGTEARPSRLAVRQVGEAVDLPDGLTYRDLREDRTETFADSSLIAFPHRIIGGGAATLTRQSLCPFQAFATARLAADDWEPAETGLNAKQRGQLLHSVLHRVWSGSARGGISSLAELQSISDLHLFVRGVVRVVMAESFDSNRRNSLPSRFPARYLQLEAERLTELVSDWLEYERERQPFTVVETEVKREVTIAGLSFTLRLDRIDTLESGGKLVIDYKSSEVGPKAWAGDRPDDVQLPLYATSAVEGDLEGLVFGRVRPGTTKFYGRVRSATETLRSDLTARDRLVSDPLTETQLAYWRERIERLGEDFLAGRAEVDPKEPDKTCAKCHLHAVCRINESQPWGVSAGDSEESGDGAENEEGAGGGDA
jgi:ATP-dependent helicase/nuclease subunit B